VVALAGRPAEVRDVIVGAVSVQVEDVRQVVRVRQEGIGHKTVYFKGLAIQADTTVALAVIGGYDTPRFRWGILSAGAQDTAIGGDIVVCTCGLIE
jgi:hypothetical protein